MSTPRNRQIAKTVKEMGLIERYGTGIKRVRRMFVDYGLPEPKFETITGGFAVTVYAKSENVNFIHENDTLNDTLNDRQKSILKLIIHNGSITNELIARELQISIETSKREIARLVKQNLIQRIGSRKNGSWRINSI